MSVINSVLRDLQEQRPTLRAIDPDELRAAPPGRRRGVLLRWLWMALGLLLLLVLAGGYLLSERQAEPEPMPTVAAVIEQPAAAAPAPVAKPDPARLEGLQIRENERSLALSFRLSSATGIYLQQQDGRRYRFVIREARSAMPAPQLAANDWMESLALRQDGDDLAVELMTAPGTRLESDEQRQPDGSQIWRLTLHRPPETAKTSPAAETVSEPAPVVAEIAKKPPLSPRPETGAQAEAAEQPVAVADNARQSASTQEPVAEAEAPAPRKLEIRASAAPPRPELERRRAAHALFRAGDYAGLLRRFGEDPAQDDLLALAHQRLGEHEQALPVWRRLLQREPGNARHWLGLAMSLEQLQQADQARAAYARARQLGGLSPRLDAYARQRSEELSRAAAAAETGG